MEVSSNKQTNKTFKLQPDMPGCPTAAVWIPAIPAQQISRLCYMRSESVSHPLGPVEPIACKHLYCQGVYY